MNRGIAPLLGFACAFVAPATGLAQTVTQIGDRPSCGSCTIGLQPVVRLGSEEDPAGFGPLVQLAVNSRGEYVASSTTFVGELFVYGSDGRFRRSIGRKGEGPGEYSRTQFLAFGVGDSLHAVEMSGTRYTVLTPDFTLGRTAVIQGRTLGFEIEPSGTIFAVSPSMTGGNQRALQVFSGSGGAGTIAFDPIDPKASGQAAMGRSIAVDAKGRRWSIGSTNYVVKQWDREGRTVRQFEAKRDWFSDSIPMRLDLTKQRPPAQVAGIETDEAGLIWVFVAVPDAKWRPLEPGSAPDTNRLFDTLLEIIDPETGTLIARGRVDALVIPFGRGRAYSMVDEPSGDRRVQVWRMELKR